MRYQKQILEAFDRLGFKPRNRQVEYINQICTAFLDEKVHNVVLSAPTGSGKSVIGAVTAETIHEIRYPDAEAGASFLLTATNVLAEQYLSTFTSIEHKGLFHVIKGASNYECSALSLPNEPQTAETCALQLFRKSGMLEIIERSCNSCEYQRSRALRDRSRHLITNYSYYFIDRMYSTAQMPRRSVCVFDEAHLLNDLFVEHNSIYFSERRLEKMAEEIADGLKLASSDIFKTIKKIRQHLSDGKINEGNYVVYARELMNCYVEVSEHAKKKAEQSIKSPSQYLKLMGLHKKYHGLACKIDDLFLFEYQHVFEHREKNLKNGQNEAEISIKPIFVSEMFEALDNAEFNLFMSATISEQYIKRTLRLPGETKTIRLEPQFDPQNKKIIFFKPLSLNYSSMKDPKVLQKVASTVKEIVSFHASKQERGIILCPSFALVERIAKEVKGLGRECEVFEHERGQPLFDLLQKFKRLKDGPAVLITPSGFEGIDLPGDLSRFQIIVKAPFASLGDRRIKFILDNYPEIYSLVTLMKIVQGAGRSVRSDTDYATTYILDMAAQKLWQSSSNEWSGEFLTSFRTALLDE